MSRLARRSRRRTRVMVSCSTSAGLPTGSCSTTRLTGGEPGRYHKAPTAPSSAADGSHLPAASAAAEEPIAAVGLEPRHVHSRRHLEALQDLSRSRIDSPQIALATFP